MSRFLIVTWDGAGNLVPTLGIAERLVQRQHDVRILGHPTIGMRADARGWRFVPFTHTEAWDSTAVANQATEIEVLGRGVWFSPAVAHD